MFTVFCHTCDNTCMVGGLSMKVRIADYLIRIAAYLLDRDIKIIPKDDTK